MGRGLSELQRDLLCYLLRNDSQYGADFVYDHGHVESLDGAFIRHDGVLFRSRHFYRQEPTRSQVVAAVKALIRLENRGLVRRVKGCARLTDNGAAIARSITDKAIG